MSKVTTVKIDMDTPDDHVFIWIKCEGRPGISLDLMNAHGRRVLHTRVNGMNVASHLVDISELEAMCGNQPHRYCPFCGTEINLYSSKPHSCGELHERR